MRAAIFAHLEPAAPGSIRSCAEAIDRLKDACIDQLRPAIWPAFLHRPALDRSTIVRLIFPPSIVKVYRATRDGFWPGDPRAQLF